MDRGGKETKTFATFDMIKGYWQIGLAATLMLATAFITAVSSLYNWKRIPMGLQPASYYYFQIVKTIIVLQGLMYRNSESYIDDIAVHGQDKDDILAHLSELRLRRYNIKLNPMKNWINYRQLGCSST
jgi:hypothetical protein